MVSVKEAVASSIKYVKDLYPEEPLNDLLLEEVELSDDEKFWLVTLGFTRKTIPYSHSALDLLTHREDYERVYKVIKVKAEDGNPVSLKIRKL